MNSTKILSWRFLFIVLLSIMGGFFGWYLVGQFLATVAGDPALKGIFGAAGDGWVGYLYRGVFLAVAGIFSFALGSNIFRRIEQLGDRMRVMSARDKLAVISGLGLGVLVTAVVSIPIILAISNKMIAVTAALLLGLVITYLSTAAALSMKEEIRLYMPPNAEEDAIPQEKYKVLDTNVIIDGRIADIARAGFLEGPLYIPGFILDELQHIADSSDDLKRQRGRRGLEILNQMQKEQEQTLVVRNFDRYAPANEPVDNRLVRLAKALNGALVTNDYNLNKVAELQGVPILNVNELANALKPVVLPGEDMEVLVVKEGKEPTQGIGYLDDGTMIVVAGGRRHIGETVRVGVTSIMQTVQGKMIFARLIEDERNSGDDDDYDGGNGGGGGVRSYSRSGPRRPIRRDGK